MEINFKARILGAVITVLLLALILPNVIKGQQLDADDDSTIPAKPVIPSWVDEKQSSRVRIELNALDAGDFEEKITAPEPEFVLQDDPRDPNIPSDRAGLTLQGEAVAWTLQLASFKNSTNAIELRDSLRSKGYKAYILKDGAGGFDRVYVGPMLQRAKAEQLQIELAKETQLKDIGLRQYTPE
ncbi:MAG: DedD protein [Oleispira sp.]|jgi:DedD protein|tara:strand:+ start:147 stop:698 length:552 start_codon:yes stop_codon:yes gene_type:complete